MFRGVVSGFSYAGSHERRLGDHKRLLTAPDVHRHNVIVLKARLDQRKGDADLEGRRKGARGYGADIAAVREAHRHSRSWNSSSGSPQSS